MCTVFLFSIECSQWGKKHSQETPRLIALATFNTLPATPFAPGLVLTCGKDNLLRTVDVRTFEVRHSLMAAGFSLGGAWASACLR